MRVVPIVVTIGGVVLPEIVVVAVAEHPVAPFVTVTVYVPSAVATGSGIEAEKPPGPAHTQVGGAALELAINCTLVAVQFTLPPTAVSDGGVVLPAITIVSALIH